MLSMQSQILYSQMLYTFFGGAKMNSKPAKAHHVQFQIAFSIPFAMQDRKLPFILRKYMVAWL